MISRGGVMKRNFLAIIGVLALIVGGVFVYIRRGSVTNSSQKEIEKSLPTVSIKTNITTPLGLMVKIMKDRGIDKKYGFIVEAVELPRSEGAIAFLKGDVTVNTLSPLEVANLNAEGHEVQMIAPYLKITCPVLATKESGITSLKDLKKGSKFATLQQTSAIYQIFKMMYAKKNIDVSEYFDITYTDFSFIPPLMAKGEVEFTSICNTVDYAKMITNPNIIEIGNVDELMKEYFEDEKFEPVLTGLVVTKAWNTQNPELRKNLIKAYNESMEYYQEHQVEILSDETIAKKYDLTSEQIGVMDSFSKKYGYYNFKPWAEVVADNQILINYAKEVGVVENVSDPTWFVVE